MKHLDVECCGLSQNVLKLQHEGELEYFISPHFWLLEADSRLHKRSSCVIDAWVFTHLVPALIPLK